MRFQLSTEYAIRILQYLCSYSRDFPTAVAVSEATGVRYPTVLKIATQLKQHELLTMTRDRNGGYMLAKPATEISIYDIFLAIEGRLQISNCLKDRSFCTRGAIEDCPARDYFLSLQNDMIAFMSSQNIADLVR